MYAIRSYYETLTRRVQRWRDFGPRFLPLPHPSPRNTLWLQRIVDDNAALCESLATQ